VGDSGGGVVTEVLRVLRSGDTSPEVGGLGDVGDVDTGDVGDTWPSPPVPADAVPLARATTSAGIANAGKRCGTASAVVGVVEAEAEAEAEAT
jgi:hypothetical protein